MNGKYEAIDPTIKTWVKKHGLDLVTSDRDWPVRTVYTGGGTKGSRSYQIWVDAPDGAGNTVHYVIDGKLENLGAYYRFMTGTWSQGTTKGDFKLTRN